MADEPNLKLVEPVKAASYTIITFKSFELPQNYVGLVFSKWLRSLRFGNPMFKMVETEPYYSQYHKYLENLLSKPDSITRLAVLTEDHDVVLGFSVSREDVLDYIYVHRNDRRLGIASKMIPKGITTMTHITVTGMEIWRKHPKYKNFKFNPFA